MKTFGVSALVRLAWNDVRLTARDRAAFVWILLLPIGMMWIFGQGGGNRGPGKASLVVEDRDGGFVARDLYRELAADGTLELGEGTAKVPARRLILPAGLSAGVRAKEPQVLRLEVSEEASRDLSQNVDAVLRRALVRTLGGALVLELEGTAEVQEDEAAVAARFAEIAARPPRVTLAVSTVGRARAAPRGYAQSVPGILTMVVMMMTLIYGGVFLVLEKEGGLLRRQLTLPLARSQLVTAKILGRLLIAAVQIALLLVVGRFLFGLDLGASKLGLVVLLGSYAVAVAGLSILLGAAAKSREQASTLGWLASMALAALGGCWWPAEIMPEWLQRAALALPTTWAMDGLHQLISYGNGLAAIALPSLVLLAFGLSFGALGVRVLLVE